MSGRCDGQEHGTANGPSILVGRTINEFHLSEAKMEKGRLCVSDITQELLKLRVC